MKMVRLMINTDIMWGVMNEYANIVRVLGFIFNALEVHILLVSVVRWEYIQLNRRFEDVCVIVF